MPGATKLLTAGGGAVQIQPASSIAADVTVQVPSRAGTLAMDGPAFSAYGSALQSVSNVSWTKVQYNTKSFDTNSNFDATSNYRFTPSVAGYYQLNAAALAFGTTAGGVQISIWKNGSALHTTGVTNNVSGTNTAPTVSAVVYANGSTDYFEVYVWNNNGPLNMGSNNSLQSFSGALVRSA